MKNYINQTEILQLVVTFNENIEDENIYLGGVHFSRNGGEFSLDTTQVIRGGNTLMADLERDDAVFNQSKYNLTSEDLVQGVNIKVYIETESPILGMHVIARQGEKTFSLPATREQ